MGHCNGWTGGLSFKAPSLAPIPDGEDRTEIILLQSCELARMLLIKVLQRIVWDDMLPVVFRRIEF